jgi:hypothetical protein
LTKALDSASGNRMMLLQDHPSVAYFAQTNCQTKL